MTLKLYERWLAGPRKNSVVPKVDAFLDEIVEVCRKHDLMLEAGDSHSGINVVTFDEFNAEVLRKHAHVCETVIPGPEAPPRPARERRDVPEEPGHEVPVPTPR